MNQDELCLRVREVIGFIESQEPDAINQALILASAAQQIKAATQANAMRHALWNALNPNGRK